MANDKKKIKVLFCTTVFTQIENGPSKFGNLLVELNKRSDIELHFLTEDVDQSKDMIHKVSMSPNYGKFGLLPRMFAYSKRVSELISKLDLDIIWFNNAIEGFVSAKLNYNTPHIGMINDDNSVLVSLKQYGFSYKYIRHFIFRLLERLAISTYAKVIVNSKYLLRLIEEHYPGAKGKVILLYKSVSIDITGFNTSEIYPDKEIRVLFVKSDFFRGGLDDLLTALGMLPYKFRVTIIGPDEEDISNLTCKVGISKNILINVNGRLPQKAVFDCLLSHHIFCTPSKMEALGVANMEAMVHKISVVYTNVGGIPEVMDFGRNGFEAEPGNPVSLASAIDNCIKNKQLRESKKNLAYHFIATHFNKTKMLENYLCICRSVLKK